MYACKAAPRLKHVSYCRDCDNKRQRNLRKKNPEKTRATERRYRDKKPWIRAEIAKRYFRTPRGRLATLRMCLNREGISQNDLLRNEHFYFELIRDNECHYCLGPLTPSGHALDRIDNNVGHVSFNIVPCCQDCNKKKLHNTSYEEMMLLAPALREIRKRRLWQTLLQWSVQQT